VVSVAVANVVQYALHLGCGSIICPVPFPSRLITQHTSTASAVVNNTVFTRRDAIVAAVGHATDQTEVLGEPTLSDVSHRIGGRQMTYSLVVRPVG